MLRCAISRIKQNIKYEENNYWNFGEADTEAKGKWQIKKKKVESDFLV